MRIPNSDLLVITDENNGAYIYDLITHQTIVELDVKKDNYFHEQYANQYGPI